MLFWNNITIDKQKRHVSQEIYSLKTVQNQITHSLGKLHGFAIKVWKKYRQIGILTSTILSRWHIAVLLKSQTILVLSQESLLK